MNRCSWSQSVTLSVHLTTKDKHAGVRQDRVLPEVLYLILLLTSDATGEITPAFVLMQIVSVVTCAKNNIAAGLLEVLFLPKIYYIVL